MLGWWLVTVCNSYDCHMQGFASGDLERDATAIRMFADDGMEMLLAQSYAKNMVLHPLSPISQCCGGLLGGSALGAGSWPAECRSLMNIRRDISRKNLCPGNCFTLIGALLGGCARRNGVVLRAGSASRPMWCCGKGPLQACADGACTSAACFGADACHALQGLYGERVGALTVVSRSADIAKRVESQLKLVCNSCEPQLAPSLQK